MKLDCVWNVMAHPQKPHFLFRRKGRVHLNRQGRQFSRLPAAEVCASVVVMPDTPCSEVVWRVLANHSIRQFPLQFPSRASPFAITFQLDSNNNSVQFLHSNAVAQWLSYCATNQKVAGSILDVVMRFFIDINPSDRNMALGSTQPLTELSTRCISRGKFSRCVRLTTLPPYCALVKKSGNLNFLEPSGPPKACNGVALVKIN
jgi:hypothetical protein